MKKILFCIPTLVGGGAERVFVTLMNNINREKYTIDIGVLREEGVFLSELNKDITLYNLNTNMRGALLGLYRLIKQTKPDIVISTISYLNLVVGCLAYLFRKRDILWLARETGIPSLRKKLYKSVWNMPFMYRAVYKNFNKIICQSTDMKIDVEKEYGLPNDKLIVINNPVDTDLLSRNARREKNPYDSNEYNIVTAGRLHAQKGYNILIEALFMAKNKKMHLHILGEGEKKEELLRKVEEHSLESQVTFHGFKRNPYPYMVSADLYVITSIAEGFPNALLEAMALGCPAIAVNAPGGINEIVHPGLNGSIVPQGDILALADEMNKYTNLIINREAIAENIYHRYGKRKIISEYETVIDNEEEKKYL